MSRITPFAIGFAVPFSLLSSAALADVTPAQVWGDWRQYMEGFNYTVDATETTNGADLMVKDIVFGFAIPDDNGDMKMSVGTIDFKQNSDGTVAIVMPDRMPITFKGNGAFANGKNGGRLELIVSQTGHVMTASGTPDKMTYAYTAQKVEMEAEQIELKVQEATSDSGRLIVTANDVSNTTTMTIGDMRGYEQSSSIASATFQVFMDKPAPTGETVNAKASMTGLKISGAGAVPLVMTNTADMNAMLDAGFDITGSFAYAGGSSDVDVQDPKNGNFKMQTSSQGGTLNVAVGAAGLAYGGTQKGVKIALNAATLPFPVELAMAESGFNLSMPVQKADEAQDFAFGINLGDFTMSDMIWGIFDGAGQLPRDPATIKLDLSGKAKVLVDFMNPEAAAKMTGAPGEVKALKLNTLLVDAVGTKLEGSGDITFDGAGPAMVPGIGNPVGAVSLALAGGNGLIDKLIAMGLLPQEQAMGARMMMGIFAVPGDAPDTLKSKIEFTQDGQILANGQRIR